MALGNGAILSCRDLRKSYGSRRAVAGVGFEIAVGETYGLLGPNGAGKTTTISMVCGLLERDSGEVRVEGRPLTTTTTGPKAAIGFVPQDIAIYPDLTGVENLNFFGKLYGLRGKELAARVRDVLEIAGLSDRGDDRTDRYSGGMKRRLNIAIALLHKPRLLILDEPTVGVDPQSRNAILSSVEALSTEGMAVLYTTHYMEEAERLCDRVGIIDEGEVRAEGTRRELVSMLGEHDRVSLAAHGELARAAQRLTGMPEVQDAGARDGGIELIVSDASTLLPAILQSASDEGVTVTGVEVVEPDLEAVFLRLTGKALRD
ncbi:MAG: ABC transporter ATP-binding protein [Actinomycetota bacterium]